MRIAREQFLRSGALAVLTQFALAVVGSAGAQRDIEMSARAAGRTLPSAYYDRIRRHPEFFGPRGGWIRRASQAQALHRRVTGTLRMLVVPVLFADSHEPTITPLQIQQRLFDGPAPYGTVTAFYQENSLGALTLNGEVTPWVRSSLTISQVVGSSKGLGEDARVGDFLFDALTQLDPQVDFGHYDSDGFDDVPNSGDDDGSVDMVVFLFQEISGSCGGPGVWPHMSAISQWIGHSYSAQDQTPAHQPIQLDNYIILSATDCSGTQLLNSPVIAHETGHLLGLPDLYDPIEGIEANQRRWVVGCWDLMAAGSWGCGSSGGDVQRPPHFTAWCKERLGWITPQVVGSVRNEEFLLHPASGEQNVLRVPIAGSAYYLVEYRQKSGFDVGVPASGVLISYIDPDAGYPVDEGAPRIYPVMLVEADADSGLVKTAREGGDRGDAGDAFGATTESAFSNITLPSARRHDGVPTTITVHSILADPGSGVASVRLTTAPTIEIPAGQRVVGAVALGSVDARIEATGGALPYQWTITGNLPPGLVATPIGDTLRLSGTPTASGDFPLTVTIHDALDASAAVIVTARVTAPVFATTALAQTFLSPGQSTLTPSELAYLDHSGNNNGSYDVGDLRAYLVAHPSTAALAISHAERRADGVRVALLGVLVPVVARRRKR